MVLSFHGLAEVGRHWEDWKMLLRMVCLLAKADQKLLIYWSVIKK